MEQDHLNLYRLEQWSSAFGEWPLYPYAIEESIRNGVFSYSEKRTDFMIINLLLDGELVYRCMDDNEYFVRRGDLFLVPLNSSYSFTTTAVKHYHKLVLEIKGDLLLSFCGLLQLDSPLHMVSPPELHIEEKIREIGVLLHDGSEKNIPRILAGLHELLSALSLSVRGDQEKNVQILMKAQSRLENDIGGTLSISSLSAELGICQSMLNRLFRKKLGISPMKYRIRYRLKNACHVLTHSSMPIKEIALRFGYSNQLYFSNDFKHHFGMSPKAFRDSHSD